MLSPDSCFQPPEPPVSVPSPLINGSLRAVNLLVHWASQTHFWHSGQMSQQYFMSPHCHNDILQTPVTHTSCHFRRAWRDIMNSAVCCSTYGVQRLTLEIYRGNTGCSNTCLFLLPGCVCPYGIYKTIYIGIVNQAHHIGFSCKLNKSNMMQRIIHSWCFMGLNWFLKSA